MLCAALLLAFLPRTAHAVTLTAVNDTILPLDEGTMPARLGGEMYVPYSVFTSLGVSASSSGGVLDLSANGETLSFSTEEGYVYDQNLVSYSTPAYSMNGTIYVPVKLCCGKFGLSYSTLTVSGESVLRIADGSAQSDAAFVAAHSTVIENTIDDYNGGTPSKPDRNNGNTNTNPKPAADPDKAEILDALHDSGRQAAFFLPVDTEKWDDDLVRRIAAEGHTVALLLDADDAVSGADMTAALSAANARLTLLTGAAARIIANQRGSDTFTEAQRTALISAGFRLWDAGLDSGDAEKNAASAYTKTVQYFASTEGVVVVRLHHSKSTARLTEALCSYMGRQGIPAGHISYSTTPVNSAADTR